MVFLLIFVGFCVVCGLAYYNWLKSLKKTEDTQLEEEKLIKHSATCQTLIYEFNQSIHTDKPTMSNQELTRRLREIISDPEERDAALSNLAEQDEIDQQERQERTAWRIVGYKYEIDVFEIFGSNKTLSRSYVVSKIAERHALDRPTAEELLTVWMYNRLVERHKHSDDQTLIVGAVLEYRTYSLRKTDLTRSKWLAQNNMGPVEDAWLG